LKTNTPHILVGTPESVLTLEKEGVIKLNKIRHFILDECDIMLDSLAMREDIQKLLTMIPQDKQVMMFSATISKEIREVCKKFINNPSFCMEIYVDDEAKLILYGVIHHYVMLEENEKNNKLLGLLESLDFNQIIIFVNSVARAKELNKIINENNFPSICTHPDLQKEERIAIYKSFKDFNERILVATDIFERGVDFERVNVVINYDVPENRDDTNSYLHRVGRTGRFGTRGLAISFVASNSDIKIINDVQKRFFVTITKLPDKIDVKTYNY